MSARKALLLGCGPATVLVSERFCCSIRSKSREGGEKWYWVCDAACAPVPWCSSVAGCCGACCPYAPGTGEP
uniref:Putative secreted protein n=1 Tax=Anopheles triannulatus TaxID=58253 RepID=A0A2M4B741_9DIPT